MRVNFEFRIGRIGLATATKNVQFKWSLLCRDLLTLGEQLYIQKIPHFVAEKTSFQISHGSLLCDQNRRLENLGGGKTFVQEYIGVLDMYDCTSI